MRFVRFLLRFRPSRGENATLISFLSWSFASQGVGAHGVLQTLLDRTDYEGFLRKHNPDSLSAKWQNVQELVRLLVFFLSSPLSLSLSRKLTSPFFFRPAHLRPRGRQSLRRRSSSRSHQSLDLDSSCFVPRVLFPRYGGCCC